ncbi:PREDICTED: putative lipase ROG1 [Tarenaya hassleriana]|uniref:putative lipase ROG1 n=1 Tax=Tarenaya hassleriana TaxID=28532 RepID=UPI00053C3992|nr:PREDICTED: putative lipase ROG1 [Tarenaya hassleriana]
MMYLRWIGCGCFPANNRGRGLKSEIDSGGEDVFDSAAMESAEKPDHLVVMVNGIVGSAGDWKFAAEQFVKKLPNQVIVHRSESNYAKLTFDGVDLMGERLANEVLSVIKHRSGLRKISFVAHSLGGLIARYAVGRLYEQTSEANSLDPLSRTGSEKGDRIAGLEPMNFITFATPHLGSRGHRQFPILCGLPFLERTASQTAHLAAGRTGKHLFLVDKDDSKPPLLLRMATDSDNLKFISALHAFKRRTAYANVNYDYMVGWRTSSIRRQNELPKPDLLATDPKYPHIIHVEHGKMDNVSCKPISTLVVDENTNFEEEMIKGLTQLPWERVDVSFHKSKQRYVAHNTIQVKTYWLNSDGTDVVFHMIDNFRL